MSIPSGLQQVTQSSKALGSRLIVKDQKLNVELHPYFKVIFDNLAMAEKELLQVRTSENAVNKGQIANILAVCPNWRRVEDSPSTKFLPSQKFV